MATSRPLLLVCACSLFVALSLPAQSGAGGYFQTLVKDAKTRIREINAAQLSALQKSDPSPMLVDVREDNEWDKGRIPGRFTLGEVSWKAVLSPVCRRNRPPWWSTARVGGGPR